MTEVFLAGTPGQVVEQAAEWRDAGLRHLIVAFPFCSARP
jgi:alkanesulfonate monooxygenase SsuD/methylene tetrahydromethanopterin reductase-like flavin-dependent oxidoreductase (luciferase family)